MISVEDVDLVNPAAGHEEALPLLQLGDTEPLDVLNGRGEAAQEWLKKMGARLREFTPQIQEEEL